MAAMSVEDFITTYIDFGEYNGLFPEEEVTLLRVAAAFYTEFATNINPGLGYPSALQIDVVSGDRGSAATRRSGPANLHNAISGNSGHDAGLEDAW